ncbi:MAG: hypothetical protein U1E21_09870 [Reyranellaceae bacterium]
MRAVSIALLVIAGCVGALPSLAQAPAGRPANPASAPPASQSPLPTLNMTVPQRDREAVYAYYRAEMAAGRCPLPLVKMSNACLAPSPGKAAWRLDQPLADGIKGEAPPAALIAKLSPSPAGYHYLRVENDLLVVGIGTRIVAALVADLSKL